ncbi:response regulator transcription factor [Streptomyces sp. ISL-22]|uniref:response regulator transcription factor n=1 Tax=unclassified Streptomyces TaxID=2593676 RepID=UPI001BEAF305|nr:MULTISPECIES: response regulator transcription factor [unclassified Streptomyces]MBT2417408.1 response regulator transcription factor [Streptomyces sp. ISL-24]MBT2434556.1 response regulator transcription factor [Streptomyces sp. ISL-22]
MPKPPSTDAVPDVLLVVGDPHTSEPLSAMLELAGHRTVVVDRATEAAVLLTGRRFDLVILDVTLPDVAELKSCPCFLAPDRPAVLLLTGGGEFLGSMPGGGGPGGDGPTSRAPGRVAEVLARARQLVRGNAPAGWDGALRHGDLALDDATRRARRGERTIELTPAEYRLLRCLLLNAERVLSKEQIGRHVWDDPPTDGAVERLVSRLRRKVNGEQAALIHTRRGFGYWLGRATRP